MESCRQHRNRGNTTTAPGGVFSLCPERVQFSESLLSRRADTDCFMYCESLEF